MKPKNHLNIFFEILGKLNIQVLKFISKRIYPNKIHQISIEMDVILIFQTKFKYNHPHIHILIMFEFKNKQIQRVIFLDNNQQSIQNNLQLPMSSSLKYQEQSQSVRYFKYELYHQIPIREPWCGILQLNHQQTLLFAAGAMRILIFQFKNTLKPLFQIREESQAISNIFTKQNSNQVFVGNCQGNIKIFQTIGINNTKIQIKIKAHKKSITSFVMSKDASLLITCSLDGQIKFWTFEDSFSYKQTINSHEGGVCKISLNQSENQIISCGKQKFIFIIEQSSFNKRWFISQKIELESYGYGICFISENLFAFQSTQNQDILFIYQRQKGTQLYNQIKDFQLNYNSQYCLFIQQFIAQKSLLISKKGNFIIVKEETNIQLLENSAVEFDIIDVYGSVSDDGEYLISCDDQSKVISIRKYKMI